MSRPLPDDADELTIGRPLRVLVVSSLYRKPLEFTGDFLHRQVLELTRCGVEATVICPVPLVRSPDDGGWAGSGVRRPQVVDIDDVTVHYLPYWNVPHRLSARLDSVVLGLALHRWIQPLHRREQFSVIHAHRLFPTAHAAAGLAERLGLPLVATAHGSDVHTNPSANPGIGRATREVMHRCDTILGVSRALAQQATDNWAPVRPVRVAYNAVDTDRFRPSAQPGDLRRELGLPLSGVGICAVNRLVAAKGLGELLVAFRMVTELRPDVWLAIVGDGPLRPQLARAIREDVLEGRVFLAGARAPQEIPAWLNAADIFVLASHNEGLPNVVLEAMACAKPVVSTRVGGVAEAAVEGETALLVPAKDPGALAAALLRLADAPELRRRLGQAGLERVEREFSPARNARVHLQLYQEAVDRTRRSRAPLIAARP